MTGSHAPLHSAGPARADRAPALVGADVSASEVHTAICGLGVAIDDDRLGVVALDARGRLMAEHSVDVAVNALSPREVADRVATLVSEAVAQVRSQGLVPAGMCVGVPGLVRDVDGTVVAAPSLGWREAPLAAMLAERIGEQAGPLRVESEGNLATVAEAAARGAACDDLVVLSGGVRLGGGVYSGGRTLRGKHGFAGELGHLQVDRQGIACNCGRTGCWETKVGLRALLSAAADPDDPVHDPATALTVRLAEIDRRAGLGDVRTLAALHQVGSWLGVGAAALVNVLNPGVIVLSGYFAVLGEWLRQPLHDELVAGAVAPQAGGCRVEASTLGVDVVAHGGALVALGSGSTPTPYDGAGVPDTLPAADLIATPSIGGTS